MSEKKISKFVKQIQKNDKYYQLTGLMTPGITSSHFHYERTDDFSELSAHSRDNEIYVYKINPELQNKVTSLLRDLITLELSLETIKLQFYYAFFGNMQNDQVLAILSKKSEQIIANAPKFSFSNLFSFFGPSYPPKLLEGLETLELLHEQVSPLMNESDLNQSLALYFQDIRTRIDPNPQLLKTMHKLEIENFESPLKKEKQRPVDLKYKVGWLIELSGNLKEDGLPKYDYLTVAQNNKCKSSIDLGEIARLVLFPTSRIYQLSNELLVPHRLKISSRVMNKAATLSEYLLHPQRLVYHRKTSITKNDIKENTPNVVIFLIKTIITENERKQQAIRTFVLELEASVSTGESLRLIETNFKRAFHRENPLKELEKQFELIIPKISTETHTKLKNFPTRESTGFFENTCGVDSDWVNEIFLTAEK